MAKKCIYCSAEIDQGSVVDMCQRCMYQVWGEKMAKAIVENMESERGKGNLDLGRVGENRQVLVKEDVIIEESPNEELIIEEVSASELDMPEREQVLDSLGEAESFIS